MIYTRQCLLLGALLGGLSGCGSAESGRNALGLNQGSRAPEAPASPRELVGSDVPPTSPVGAETCAVERIVLRETRRPIVDGPTVTVSAVFDCSAYIDLR